MTRLFLITLLVLSSGPAYAEWVEVKTDDEREMTLYIDSDTIRRKGDVVKWWELMDFKTLQTVGVHSYSSVKVQHEFNCAEELHRSLAITQFSDNMGQGKPGYSSSKPTKWEPVEPASLAQSLWKIACEKE